MASLSDKYTTILDALEYAASVLRERPDDINMVFQIGSIYFDKLGGSQEKAYYRPRVREDKAVRRVPSRTTRPRVKTAQIRYGDARPVRGTR